MAFAVADRVKETSTTTGTGTLNLAGAEPGYQTFVAGIGNGNTTYYAIVNRATSEFEVGIGTVTDAATDTLSRDTVISSSNSDALVNFSAGTKDVICTLPSEKSYVIDNASNTSISANLTATAFSGSGASLTSLNASNVSSGTLSSDRLPTVPTTKGGTGLTAIGTANQVLAVNSGGTALEYQTISADITGVTAGNGLTGGGTSGDVTLNVGAGTGVTVNADDIAIGQDVATSASPTFAGATFTANVSLSDNDYLRLGTSQDLLIYHSGTGSFISDNGTGDLFVQTNGNVIRLENVGSSLLSGSFNPSGAVELYHNNNKKFETTSTGCTVTGTLVETSSIEYKENVQPLQFNEAIYNVNAVKYDRKDGSSKDEVGVIAEELYKVLPDLVECKDGKPEAVKYTKMTMYLLEALKKQNQEIQELKKRLN